MLRNGHHVLILSFRAATCPPVLPTGSDFRDSFLYPTHRSHKFRQVPMMRLHSPTPISLLQEGVPTLSRPCLWHNTSRFRSSSTSCLGCRPASHSLRYSSLYLQFGSTNSIAIPHSLLIYPAQIVSICLPANPPRHVLDLSLDRRGANSLLIVIGQPSSDVRCSLHVVVVYDYVWI